MPELVAKAHTLVVSPLFPTWAARTKVLLLALYAMDGLMQTDHGTPLFVGWGNI
jgi:hypothetical protein